MVETGFYLWAMSGFKRMPSQREVMEYDPIWIADLELAYQIYAHQHNNNPLMQVFEAANKQVADEDGYRHFRLGNDSDKTDDRASKPTYSFDFPNDMGRPK